MIEEQQNNEKNKKNGNIDVLVTRLRDLLGRPIAPPTVESISKELYFLSRDVDAVAPGADSAALRRLFADGFEDLEKYRRSVPQGAWNIERLMLFREKLMTLAARVDNEVLRVYVMEIQTSANSMTQQAQQTAMGLQTRLQSADVDVRLLKGRVAQLTDQLQSTQHELTQTTQQLASTSETLRQVQTKWAQANEALARANEMVEAGRTRAARITELQADKDRLMVALEEAENALRLVEQWNEQQAERIKSLERSRDNLRAKLEDALTPSSASFAVPPAVSPAQTVIPDIAPGDINTPDNPVPQETASLYSAPPIGDTDLLEQLSSHS